MMRWRWMMIVAVLALAWSCGSDTKKTGQTDPETCTDGMRWNPILARCVDPATNGSTQNSVNGATNSNENNTPTNSGDPNNTTNNENNSNNSTIPPVDMPCGNGGLIGKTCAPSGEPLAAADVTVSGIDCETGMPFEMTTRTSGDGTFEFTDVPAGTHTMTVEIGSFSSMSQVLIQKDMITDLTSAADKVCLDQNVEIAVITGEYDHVEGILESLNLTYDEVGSDALGDMQSQMFLTNLQAMNEYDIIFINCGNLYDNLSLLDFSGTVNTIATNLRAFVQGGKSLYVSDWSAPFIERAFPEMIDFVGNDTAHREARAGYAPQTITSSVETADLQAVLGRTEAEIEFPQDPDAGVINNNWAVAASVGAGATVQIAGDAILCNGTGNQCSSQGGTQEGAALLVTYKDASGGTVVFTSFHNERQSALNQDMEVILRFLIFQL